MTDKFIKQINFANLTIAFLGILVLGSCASRVPSGRLNSTAFAELSNQAIFTYLQHLDLARDMFVSKGPIKIDPILAVRDTLSMAGHRYFGRKMQSELIKRPLSEHTVKLVIPDSLTWKFIFAESGSDYRYDFATVHQFSPLLPTNEKDVFLIQDYTWGNFCEEIDGHCVRQAYRHYLKFKIDERKITFIKSEQSSNPAYDFIGFGHKFPKSTLDGSK